MTQLRSTPKILITGSAAFAADASTMILMQRGYPQARVTDPKLLISRVYDEMPTLILAQIPVATDPASILAAEALVRIKRDPVLEFIPIIAVSDGPIRHEIGRLAEETLVRGWRPEEAASAMDRLLIEVEHQLDINPFTGLPGRQTSLEQIRAALDFASDFVIAAVRFRNVEMFASLHGGLSADVLVNRMISEILDFYKQRVGGKVFFGHLDNLNFVLLLPRAAAKSFAEELARRYDERAAEYAAYATQEQFAAFKDPLRHQYTGSDRVTAAIAVMSGENHSYHSAQELVHAASQIHDELKDMAGNVTRLSGRVSTDGGAGRSKDAELVRRFLEEGRIETHFQPITDFWEGDIFAYEALSRFREPGSDDRLIHPVVLFEAARSADMVEALDLHCLRTAIEAYRALATEARLFVNLNRETFLQIKKHIGCLDPALCKSGRIVIELTEQSLVTERGRMVDTAAFLRDLGIAVAYDDVGTGDVSFREMGEIKPAFIKFDRQLITGITRSALKQRHVLSMRAFARGIGAKTIAEGIESASEFRHLKSLRLDLAQGYFLAKPAAHPVRKVEIPPH